MNDGGFVAGQVERILQVVTKGQLGASVDDDLRSLVKEIQEHAEIWVDGSKENLLNGITGQLRLQADLNESPDPILPDKLSSKLLNLPERIRLLRLAADLIQKL